MPRTTYTVDDALGRFETRSTLIAQAFAEDGRRVTAVTEGST